MQATLWECRARFDPLTGGYDLLPPERASGGTGLVVGQDERVTAWVCAQMGSDPVPSHTAIGYERNGCLVAGVFFDGGSRTNIFAHIASTAAMIPVSLLAAVADYAFEQSTFLRMTFLVNDNNHKCIKLVEALGAEREASLQSAHRSGDVLVYVLWNDFRFYDRLKAAKAAFTGAAA